MSSIEWVLLRCDIRSSNNLQEYPKRAMLLPKPELESSVTSRMPSREFDAYNCAGSLEVRIFTVWGISDLP